MNEVRVAPLNSTLQQILVTASRLNYTMDQKTFFGKFLWNNGRVVVGGAGYFSRIIRKMPVGPRAKFEEFHENESCHT